MDMRKRILITMTIGVVLVIGFYIITNTITKYTGFSVSPVEEKDGFTSCLKEQDITLYINTNDLSQSLKKIQLFDYLDNFKIVNCMRNNQACLENKISSFPTWVINNDKIDKDINLKELIDLSGCKII